VKFKDLFNITINKKTKQESWHLKVKAIKLKGLTSKELLEMTVPKPRVKRVLEGRK